MYSLVSKWESAYEKWGELVAEYTSRRVLPWKMDKIQVFATWEMLFLLMNNRNEQKSYEKRDVSRINPNLLLRNIFQNI